MKMNAASWTSSAAVSARPTRRTRPAKMPAPGPKPWSGGTSPDRHPEDEQRGCGMSPHEGDA
eukprot:16132862-Heterocapsa_arctica.AAC.1